MRYRVPILWMGEEHNPIGGVTEAREVAAVLRMEGELDLGMAMAKHQGVTRPLARRRSTYTCDGSSTYTCDGIGKGRDARETAA